MRPKTPKTVKEINDLAKRGVRDQWKIYDAQVKRLHDNHDVQIGYLKRSNAIQLKNIEQLRLEMISEIKRP